jgi:hypothetical protein
MKNLVILIALLMISSAQSAQKFYKWTDEDGNIHYSSEKPEDKQTDEVNVSTRQPKVSAEFEDDYTEEVDNDNKPEEQTYMEKHYEKKQKANELANENKKACQEAKAIIAKYQAPIRMSQVDDDTGEKIYLDDSKRAEIIKEAQNEIKKRCR